MNSLTFVLYDLYILDHEYNFETKYILSSSNKNMISTLLYGILKLTVMCQVLNILYEIGFIIIHSLRYEYKKIKAQRKLSNLFKVNFQKVVEGDYNLRISRIKVQVLTSHCITSLIFNKD